MLSCWSVLSDFAGCFLGADAWCRNAIGKDPSGMQALCDVLKCAIFTGQFSELMLAVDGCRIWFELKILQSFQSTTNLGHVSFICFGYQILTVLRGSENWISADAIATGRSWLTPLQVQSYDWPCRPAKQPHQQRRCQISRRNADSKYDCQGLNDDRMKFATTLPCRIRVSLYPCFLWTSHRPMGFQTPLCSTHRLSY